MVLKATGRIQGISRAILWSVMVTVVGVEYDITEDIENFRGRRPLKQMKAPLVAPICYVSALKSTSVLSTHQTYSP